MPTVAEVNRWRIAHAEAEPCWQEYERRKRWQFVFFEPNQKGRGFANQLSLFNARDLPDVDHWALPGG